jgi:hypothetical protein
MFKKYYLALLAISGIYSMESNMESLSQQFDSNHSLNR